MTAMTRSAAATLLTLSIGLAAGCHHAGTVPPGWLGGPIPMAVDDDAELPGSTLAGPGHGGDAQDSGNDARGLLQVFICYGKVLSNHTALRLTAPGKETLMWDPGGSYRQYEPSYARRHDVLTKNSVTVDQWWRYRRDGCREPVMEVFQWSLDADQARRLHAVLIDHKDPDNPTQTFEPDGGGLQCSKKVSEFLSRFADGRPGVDQKYFWPHELGEHLWTQQPDSVMVFRSDGESLIYRRKKASTVAEQQDDPGDRHGRAGDGTRADTLTEHRGDRQHE
jgi:hypothetical protein